jgi:hypothetical protein
VSFRELHNAHCARDLWGFARFCIREGARRLNRHPRGLSLIPALNLPPDVHKVIHYPDNAQISSFLHRNNRPIIMIYDPNQFTQKFRSFYDGIVCPRQAPRPVPLSTIPTSAFPTTRKLLRCYVNPCRKNNVRLCAKKFK